MPLCSTFPLDLPQECISAAAVSDGGEAVVCDPFMGSGTTARAAAGMGHHFIGFEFDPAMCALANSERVMDGQGMMAFG